MKENRKEVTIITACPICGRVNEIATNEEDYFDWSFDGVLAQDAFPYLSADEREMLVSGICPDCWNRMFPAEDEDEDMEDWERDLEMMQTWERQCEKNVEEMLRDEEEWVEFESGKFIYDEMAANP